MIKKAIYRCIYKIRSQCDGLAGAIMADQTRLIWAWRRLGRMTPIEIAYRAWEQVKRLVDRWRRPAWSAFGGFAGSVEGLAGFRLCAVEAALRETVANEATSARAGRFTFFGQPWPDRRGAGQPWWNGDLWLVDPISGTPWPGAERFAFDVDYRHDRARGDVKFVWELNRLQFLPPLALHAALSGDQEAAADLFAILRGWMRANPPYRGVNWVSGIEAASRVISLLAVLSFVRPATAENEKTVRRFLDAHVRWIARYPSRFSSANNHKVAELTALFAAFLCAPGMRGGAAGLRLAQRGLEREMLKQFHPDGVGAEQSVAYAAYSLEWFALAGVIGEVTGRPFSTAFRDRARLALDALCWLIGAAGQAPRIGDSDDGRVLALTQTAEPRYLASVAAMAARWLGAPAPTADPALRDLLGDPAPLSSRPTGVNTFVAGGLTVWRQPRLDGDLFLAFDHGPLGHLSIAAHGHADALALWLHWGEESILVDPGTHLYRSQDGSREALRSTRAHNTLAIGDQDQSRIIGPFAWSEHAKSKCLMASEQEIEAEQDGYRRRFGLVHRRRVRVDGDGILIEDRLLGRAKTPHLEWSLGFTLSPDLAIEVNSGRADLKTPAGRRLSMLCQTADESPTPWAVVQTPYAPSFGSLRSTLRLERRGRLDGPPLVSRVRIILAP
jgi:hypothetical protein